MGVPAMSSLAPRPGALAVPLPTLRIGASLLDLSRGADHAPF
ncbi:MAG: hypothetical protein AB7R90_13515 [Reyranellaceae bacterium]